MAQLPWVDFLQRHSSVHLVAAIVLPTRSSNHLLRLRRLLVNVIEEGPAAADFATAIVRPSEVAQIHCAFLDKGDADRLALLVGARERPQEAGGASHRAFTLSAKAELALAGSLTAKKPTGSRQPDVGGRDHCNR